MQTLDALRTRRSVRAFRPDPVPRALLETVLDAARFAPSARNQQQWHFTVVTRPDDLTALAAAVHDAQQAQGIADPRDCCFYHAPAFAIVSFPRGYAFAHQDGACALQTLFLAAHELGLGTCWINQLGDTCDVPVLRAELTRLGVPTEHVVSGCAAIGFSASAPSASPRAQDTVHFA